MVLRKLLMARVQTWQAAMMLLQSLFTGGSTGEGLHSLREVGRGRYERRGGAMKRLTVERCSYHTIGVDNNVGPNSMFQGLHLRPEEAKALAEKLASPMTVPPQEAWRLDVTLGGDGGVLVKMEPTILMSGGQLVVWAHEVDGLVRDLTSRTKEVEADLQYQWTVQHEKKYPCNGGEPDSGCASMKDETVRLSCKEVDPVPFPHWGDDYAAAAFRSFMLHPHQCVDASVKNRCCITYMEYDQTMKMVVGYGCTKACAMVQAKKLLNMKYNTIDSVMYDTAQTGHGPAYGVRKEVQS